MEFNEKQKAILRIVQETLPNSKRPFLEIAKRVGVDEEYVIRFLKELKEKGYIRRFGATLRHQEAGFDCNVMVAWKVDEDKIEKVIDYIVNCSHITHCYERKTYKEWPYNLYTMIHGRCKEECLRIIEEVKKATGIEEYELLFSDEELKKTSMKYF